MSDGIVEPTDADLVAAALGGDRSAFAAIYDRYADRLHTMSVQMLGDRDEAADVCGEVFLVAFQRLGQLRDPERLRPWLYAIVRHEVFRRTKRRSRVELVGEVNEMEHRFDQPAVEGDDSVGDAASMVRAVREAAVGLDDRDRMVLELHLQGVDGQDLADAMGTSLTTSYQLVHRMRERMERSLGALLVARHGRAECGDLSRLLVGWDGTFSVLWRKRIARHVDACAVCERRRRAAPGALLGTSGASALVAAPISVRTRVLDGLPFGVGAGGDAASNGQGSRDDWRADGFPPDDIPRSDRSAPAAVRRLLAVAALFVLVGVGLLVVSRLDTDTVAIADRGTTTTAEPEAAPTSGVGAGDPAPSTTPASPTVPGALAPTTVTSPAPPVVGPARPSVAPTTSAGTSTTSTTATTTSTAPTTTVAAPTVRLTGPSVLYARAANGAECANQAFTATVAPGAAAVTLSWSGSAAGSSSMAKSRVRNRWIATVRLPFGTTGAVTLVAEATNGGAPGRSNIVTANVVACPTIG